LFGLECVNPNGASFSQAFKANLPSPKA